MNDLLVKLKDLPKQDTHNHLNLGMKYEMYKKWAGFEIPNFPRMLNGLNEMHDIISQYTRPRCKSNKDVKNLISMSIEEAINDGVQLLEGSVDISFIKFFSENPDSFLEAIEEIKNKYSTKINFSPELGMGKTFDKELISKWAPICIDSGIFNSIDLYGPEVEEGLEDFIPYYNQANKKGLKTKAHVGEFSNAESVKRFIEIFQLKEVQHGIGAANDENVLKFLKDNKIRLNITTESNVMLKAVPSLKEHPIRKIYDEGIPISLGTDDLLFFNKTISQQCLDLIENNIFTFDEIKSIIEVK